MFQTEEEDQSSNDQASIPKGPPLPPKNFKKQRRANFGPPTALGPRALHALHALLLRHWCDACNQLAGDSVFATNGLTNRLRYIQRVPKNTPNSVGNSAKS